MHNTELNHVLMNIDSVSLEQHDYIIRGWIASSQSRISNLYVDGNVLDVQWENRPDVTKFYENRLIGENIGFTFKLPANLRNMPLQASFDNSDIFNVKSMYEDITIRSGFQSDSKDLIVVDDFYADPDMVRDYAMNNLNYNPSGYHKGERSDSKFILNGTKERFEQIIGKKIIRWNYEHYANGVFQFCTADQPIVYHVDQQMYAAMVYLTPDAPPNTGTAMYRSKVNGIRKFPGDKSRMSQEYVDTFRGNSSEMNFYDGTNFEKIDDVGNVYNRLVIFNSEQLHAATEYFGDAIDNARFFHMFFFDVEQ